MSENLPTRRDGEQAGNRNPEILDDNPTCWFVQFPDGSTDIVAKSNLNELLFEHNLWGLLQDGSEVWKATTDDGDSVITVTPMNDASEYRMTIGSGAEVHIGTHHKSRLVDELNAYYTEDSAKGLVSMYERLRTEQVRPDVIQHFAALPVFEDVEVQDGGWLFHDTLLLTLDREFRHPNTTSRTRSGSIIEAGANDNAYDLSIGDPSDHFERTVTIDGARYRLSNGEMEFLAKAVWAATKAPRVGGGE